MKKNRHKDLRNKIGSAESILNINLKGLEVTRWRSKRENVTMSKDTIMGTKYYIGKKQPWTWCCVKRACVSVTRRRVRIRLWPLTRDDSSRVLIGAAGIWHSDWRRWNGGALIGQRACRLLALARAAIDSTHAAASASVQAASWVSHIVTELITKL